MSALVEIAILIYLLFDVLVFLGLERYVITSFLKRKDGIMTEKNAKNELLLEKRLMDVLDKMGAHITYSQLVRRLQLDFCRHFLQENLEKFDFYKQKNFGEM